MLQDIALRLGFPGESIPDLEQAFADIQKADPACSSAAYAALTVNDREAFLAALKSLTDGCPSHPYTVQMAFFLSAIPALRERYAGLGLPEALLWESMQDLRYKLLSLWKNHRIWGTAAAGWHRRFYLPQLFALGRLQYEKIPLRWVETCGPLRQGDPVINVHIPACGPLRPEEVRASLSRAYGFYKDAFPEGPIPFVCHSWLLYPPMYEVFPRGSNLQKFYDLWTVTSAEESPENAGFSWVFGTSYSPDSLRQAPAETTLQKNLLTYLREGGFMGEGLGLLWVGPEGPTVP